MKLADNTTDHRRGIDHIGVSVCFVIHDGQGNIMLHKRGAGARDENGRWDIGGGAIEFGESIEDAVRREIKEEFCVIPTSVEFIHTFDAHREHAGVSTHWIALLHAVQVDPLQVQIGEPDKIADLGWFTSDTLPSPLHSQFWKAYQRALDRKIVR